MADWTLVDGPHGGIIQSLAGNDTYVFVGVDRYGVHRSIDNGQHWSAANDGLPPVGRYGSGLRIHSLAIFDSTVYAGTNAGLYRSPDWGLHWTIADVTLLGDPPTVYGFARTSAGLYAASGSGVLHSTDNGYVWNKASDDVADLAISIVAVGDTLYTGTNSSGVFRSTDSGASWAAVNSGLPGWNHINALGAKGPYVFAGSDDGVYRTSDAGESWTAQNQGIRESSVYYISTDSDDVYIGMWDGVHRSTDDGSSWERAADGLANTAANVVLVRPGDMYAGTQGGVFRSLDNGDHWYRTSTGLAPVSVQCLAVMGTRLLAGTYWDGVFWSDDFGAHWSPAVEGLEDPNPVVGAFAVAAKRLYVSSRGLSQSADSGSHWSDFSNGLTEYGAKALMYSDDYVFAGTNGGGMFRSPPDDDQWEEINNGLTERIVYALAADDRAIYAGTRSGVARSTDEGDSWSISSTGMSAPDTRTLAASATCVYAGTWRGEVYRSLDHGLNWLAVNQGIPGSPYNRTIGTLEMSGALVYAGVDTAVYTSHCGDTLWTKLGATLPARVLDLAICNEQLFAASDDGVRIYETPTSVGDESAGTIPRSFNLDQNYPNPFNPVTTIELALPVATDWKIEIFNIIGQRVETFEGQDNAGYVRVIWDASDQPSGVYLYRATAGEFTDTKRMTVIK